MNNISGLLSILIKMSIQGSVMIIAVLAFRAMFMDKLPKKTFVYLWIATAIVLLMPIQIESPVSVFNLSDKIQSQKIEYQPTDYISSNSSDETVVYTTNNLPSDIDSSDFEKIIESTTEIKSPETKTNYIPYIIFTVWISGAFVCTAWFLLSYRKWKREFSASIPCFDEFVCNQIKQFKISRKIRVLVSEKIISPLTYGFFTPVILLPKNISYDETYLTCILTHEYIHIKNFDTVKKSLFALCMCIHWFNPIVWLMVICSNRDIEISCDEEVIGIIGEDMKKAYSVVLIQAHESKRLALVSGFSRYALKERICSVMKYKKTSVAAVILSVLLIVGTVSVFGCAKWDRDKENEISEWQIKAREQADEIHEIMHSIEDSDEDVKSDLFDDELYAFLHEYIMFEDVKSDIADDEEQALQNDAERLAALEAEMEATIAAEEALLNAKIQEYNESARMAMEAQAEAEAKLKETQDEAVIEASMKLLDEKQQVLEMLMINVSTLNMQLLALSEYKEPIAGLNWPLSAEYNKLSIVFDYYIVTAGSEPHKGIDIPAEYGTDVYASNSGTVVTAEYDHELGNYIVIEHENRMSTLYAHLSEINVEAGDSVSKMDVIGKVGSTGASTGNHLHFEIRIDGIPIDPMLYVSAE